MLYVSTYHIVLEVGVHFGNVRVDQGLETVALALDAELLLSLQSRRGKQDVLDECQDTVALGNLGHTLGLANLLLDNLGGIKKVDFAVCTIYISSRP